MKKHQVLLFTSLFFIFGIGFRSLVAPKSSAIFILLLLAVVGCIIARNPKIRFICIAGIFFSLGVIRYQAALPNFQDNNFVSFYNGREVSVEGVVCAEPDERIRNRKYTLCAESLFLRGERRKIHGRILVTSRLYPKYEYGERLKISGKLESPEPFENFSYDRYLARYDIYSLMNYSKVFSMGIKQGSAWRGRILQFKNKLERIVERNIPEPQASIINAMIFGTRGGMPQDIQENFSSSGIAHLIAISGSHIMMIILLSLSLTPFFALKRNYAFFAITLLIVFYIFLIGAPASAVRAGIMGWLAMYAYQIGRLSHATFALVFSAAVMLFFNPYLLRDDAGFQLSFAAVWGIAAFSPFWEKFKFISGAMSPVVSILTMTISAYAATLPLILFYFGKLSLISPLANIVVVPLFPFIFFSSLFAIILVIFFPGFSYLIFFIPNALGLYLIRSGEFFTEIPYAYFEIQYFPFWAVWASYALFFYFIYFSRLWKRE